MKSKTLSLKALLAALSETELLIERIGDDDEDVSMHHLTFDSRKVQTDGCFVAIRGHKTDGHLFFDQAVLNGARVIIMESMPGTDVSVSGITLLRVKNSAKALSIAAQAFYGWPARQMKMVGVTGTNGKTTVTHLVSQLLSHLGVRNTLIGTIAITINDERKTSSMTTPDAIKVNEVLADAVEAGVTHAILEVSSHALEQDRLFGIDFQVAAFTNLSRDHLDFHRTLDAYLSAKRILFESLSKEAIAVVNTHDESWKGITDGCKAVIWESDKALSKIDLSRSKLTGRFNAYNMATALLIGSALGFGEQIEFLHEADPVPGRFEQIQGADGLRVIVDYAHTPDALENALVTARDLEGRGDLIVVFGCGGDRDKGKRPLMGELAGRLADKVYVTSDNPRSEDPAEIIKDILDGFGEGHPADRLPGLRPEVEIPRDLQGRRSQEGPTSTNAEIPRDRAFGSTRETDRDPTREILAIPDRRLAIQTAIRDAKANDVILIAGKGHEAYQVLKDKTIDFDDKTISQDALALR